jgi:hypothetical protein
MHINMKLIIITKFTTANLTRKLPFLLTQNLILRQRFFALAQNTHHIREIIKNIFVLS